MAERLNLPRLYPITDTGMAGLKKHYQIVELLCKSGVALIQMRAPFYSSWEWYYDAVIGIKTAKRFKAELIINDRIDVAMAVGADGVHIGNTDLPPEKARELMGKNAVIGYSTRSVEEAEKAAETGLVDYVAIGPIYKTASKSIDVDPLGLEVISKLRSRTSIPIVAIGGIDAEKAPEVIAAGADSAACISSVMKGNISVNTDRLIKRLANV